MEHVENYARTAQNDDWFVSSSGYIEYWVGNDNFSSMEDARAFCWEHGADLAYSEIIDEKKYRCDTDFQKLLARYLKFFLVKG